jgi:hypothetical protein
LKFQLKIFLYLILKLVAAENKICLVDHQKVLTRTFTDVFNPSVSGESEAALKLAMESNGVDTRVLQECFDALKAFILFLNKSDVSSKENKAELVKTAERYLESVNSFVRSQPGLEDFETSKCMQADPLNKEFFDTRHLLTLSINSMKNNPTAASDIFNAQSAEKYARMGILTGEFSNREQLKKIRSEL